MKTSVRLAILFVLFTISSCKKPAPLPYMFARVNNSDWSSHTVVAVLPLFPLGRPYLQTTGTAPNGSVVKLTFYNYPGNPSYYSVDTGGLAAVYYYTKDSDSYACYGKAYISSISSDFIQGSFSFTCFDSTKVLNGVFGCKRPDQ